MYSFLTGSKQNCCTNAVLRKSRGLLKGISATCFKAMGNNQEKRIIPIITSSQSCDCSFVYITTASKSKTTDIC